jgi:antitoxin component of MazEF toxin-antitoxin module
MAAEYARKTVKLRRSGGSQAVVLPKAWLKRLGATDEVDLVQTDEGILIAAPAEVFHSIEQEPEFAEFLHFLLKDSLNRPEQLGDVGELTEGDEELFRDVRLD